MQTPMWMRPALQKSEAVLMTAMPRRAAMEPRFSDRLSRVVSPAEDPFRPMPPIAQTPAKTLELSTYVRPRGSMAGRGVLRAAGYSGDPYARRARPRPRTQAVPGQNFLRPWRRG